MSGRVLLVDSDVARRACRAQGLAAARYGIVPCATGAEAEAALEAGTDPDLIAVDLGEGGGAGAAGAGALVAALRAALRARGQAAAILALAAPDRPDLRLAALRAGADAAADRDAPPPLIEARIRALIRAAPAGLEREMEGLGLPDPRPPPGLPPGLPPGPDGHARPGLAEAPSEWEPPDAVPPLAGIPVRLLRCPGEAEGDAFAADGLAADGRAEDGGEADGSGSLALRAAPARADGPSAPGAGGTGGRVLAALARLGARIVPEGPPGAAAEPPVLVVVEAGHLSGDPGGRAEAIRALVDLRARPSTREALVALILPEAAVETAALALDLGAGEVIAAGADPADAADRLALLIARRAEALRLRERVVGQLRAAVRDPLTGLHNRRFAEPALARLAERARRTGRPLALLILDLDRFKAVNDRHGHLAGDRVLAEVARRLAGWAGEDRLVARLGGEEFLVALPDTDAAGARAAADALRRVVGAAPYPLDRPPGGEARITASVGAAAAAGPGLGTDALLARADAALFAAKAAGRDQVALSPEGD